jgi:hypothetical protein
MGSWRDRTPRQLKKVVYALTDKKLRKVIEAHEGRGWSQASEIKEHGYGYGCLMIWIKQERSVK